MPRPRSITCRKRWAPAARFWITITTAGWISTWSTAARAISTSREADPQRALQEQSRRHVHRRHREGGSGGRHLRHGRGGGRLRQRRLPRSVRHGVRPPDSLSQQRQRHLHRRHREGRAGRDSLRDWTTSAVWFDYDNDGRLDLFVCSFVDYGTTSTSPAATTSWASTIYCIPRVFKPTRSFLFHNNGDGTFTEVSRGTDIEQRAGQGPGRGGHRYQQRRAHGSVRGQRHRAELPVRESRTDARASDGRRSRSRPKWASAKTASARSGMGVDAADFDGDGWEDLFVANVDQEMFSLYQNKQERNLSRCGAQATAWRRPPGC